MNRETILFIIVLISCIGLLIALWKYKKEYLYNIAYYAVIQAEELYKSKQGQEKLLYAVNYIRLKLPWWLSWLISVSAIKFAIESVLSNLQCIFKGSKDKQLFLLNEIKANGATGINISRLEKEIDKNGYIDAYIEGRTNLKGKSEVVAGVKAGMKL